MKNEKSFSDLSDFSAEITKAVETAAKSIVAIDARPRVATSGIVWREKGIIVSTNHTIRRDENITVVFADGRTSTATLIGRDAGTDLAILKIDDEEIAASLQTAEITETTKVSVGNIVLAVGRTSADAGATASFGIVGSIGAAFRTWGGDEIERFIGLDLAIRLGFSGGASVDTDGKILGVNTSAFGRGLALTIPTETVNRVVDAILKNGKISKPYLGIGTQAVALQESVRGNLELEQSSGLMMLTVEADGAAEKAGVLIGDILLSLNEKQTLEPSDVQSALWGREAGETVAAKILRGGEIVASEIVLGARPTREEGGKRQREHGGRGRRGGFCR